MNPDELAALLDSLPPEVLEQLLGMGSLPERAALEDQRMGMADMLRQPGPRHSSPTGALFGGIGNLVGALGGAHMQGQAMNNKATLLDKADAGRGSYAKTLREYGRKKQMPTEPSPAAFIGIDPFQA